MSFDDKDYPNRKDWRKCYRKSKRHDRTCRPHGSCNYCRDNRLHSTKLRELKAESDLKDKE